MTDKRAAKIIYQSGEGISIQLMCRLSDDLRSSRKTISALEKRMHDLEGQTIDELDEHIAVHAGTVKSRLSQSLRYLKEQMNLGEASV